MARGGGGFCFFAEDDATASEEPTTALGDLSEDEIEDMLEDAIDHAETDIDERLLIDARIEAEQIANQVKKAIDQAEALLDAGEKNEFEALLAELDKAMSGTDRQQISTVSKKIDEVTAPFAQRRIERDLELAIQGKSASTVAEELGVSK